MKNRLVVLLAGLCLGALTACGGVDMQAPEPTPSQASAGPVDGTCPICPLDAKGAMSVRTPVKDEVTGQYYCPPCDGGYCGDGSCSYPETASSCPDDCGGYCGDGSCNNGETASSCRSDCGYCGDGYCDSSRGESSSSCSSDCGPTVYCGDGICNNGETFSSCSQDCGGYCGDGFCGQDESGWCTSDCGTCLRYPCPL